MIEAKLTQGAFLILGATAFTVSWQFMEIGPEWALVSLGLWWVAIASFPLLGRVFGYALVQSGLVQPEAQR